MGCLHCFSDCTQNNQHMSIETLEKTLKFIKEVKPKLLLVSGGEPFEHPLLMIFLNKINELKIPFSILSNGEILGNNPELIYEIDSNFEYFVGMQVTNVDGLYPRKVNIIEHDSITYVKELQIVDNLGRAKSNNVDLMKYSALKRPRKVKPCYNLRQVINYIPDIKINSLVSIMEHQLNKFCSPSITYDGLVHLSEYNCCQVLGNVDNLYEINENINKCKYNNDCNNCQIEGCE